MRRRERCRRGMAARSDTRLISGMMAPIARVRTGNCTGREGSTTASGPRAAVGPRAGSKNGLLLGCEAEEEAFFAFLSLPVRGLARREGRARVVLGVELSLGLVTEATDDRPHRVRVGAVHLLQRFGGLTAHTVADIGRGRGALSGDDGDRAADHHEESDDDDADLAKSALTLEPPRDRVPLRLLRWAGSRRQNLL